MEVRIQAIHFDATEKLQDFIQKKTAKLEKYCDDINKVEVSLKVVKPETAQHRSTSTLPQRGAEGYLQACRRRPDAEARRSRPPDRFEPAVPRAGREARVYRRRRSRCGVPLSERGGH